MRKGSIVVISLLVIGLISSGAALVKDSGPEITIEEVEGSENSIYSFNVSGSVGGEEILQLDRSKLNTEPSNLRIGKEGGIAVPLMNYTDLSFRITDPGVYHIIAYEEMKLAYSESEDNCGKFATIPKGYREVEKCPTTEVEKNEETSEPKEEKESGEIGVKPVIASLIVFGLIIAGYIYIKRKRRNETFETGDMFES